MRMDLESIDVIDEDMLRLALPKQLGKSIPVGLVDTINMLAEADDMMRQGYRDNVIGYATVLTEGRWKIKDYLNAVRFCTYRMGGMGVAKSYNLTFPERYKRMSEEGASQNYMSSLSTQYNKSKIVNLILEQAMVPVYLVNADAFQKAINAQLKILSEGNSEIAIVQAANSLMTHLKPPETRKLEVDININEGSAIDELRQVTRDLAAKQLESIVKGTTDVKSVAESVIIEGEVNDD